jgi:hypothetical protein
VKPQYVRSRCYGKNGIRETKDKENIIICKIITNTEENTCDDVYCNDISFPGFNCWNDQIMKTTWLSGTEKKLSEERGDLRLLCLSACKMP